MGIPERWVFDLLVSRTVATALHDDSFVDDWLARTREEGTLQTEIVPLTKIAGWRLDPGSGNLVHDSGRFFTITGLTVRHRQVLDELEWEQPIIEQPEIGILGIGAKRIGGVLHFCLQAKEEPGNIGGVQLSPTVQATFSNYTRVHHGNAPAFLDLFLQPPSDRILFSRLQTEDGSRFLYKSNRNMVVVADDEIPDRLPPGFIWVTLRQISGLLRRNNAINACARSILSNLVFAGVHGERGLERFVNVAGGPGRWRSLFDPEALDDSARWIGSGRGESLGDTLLWIDNRKALNHIVAKRIGLAELKEWRLDGKGFISHTEGRFFRIIGLQVSAKSREVHRWNQPIIENPTSGIIGLLIRETPSGREILMQTKAEVGNRPTVQIAPTVQFTPGNYYGSRKLKKPFLFEEFISGDPFIVEGDTLQPEEGARFFREAHTHRILVMPEGMTLDIPDHFRWLPVSHVAFLSHLGDQVNSSARSALCCLL
jgi:oxidase EvaA